MFVLLSDNAQVFIQIFEVPAVRAVEPAQSVILTCVVEIILVVADQAKTHQRVISKSLLLPQILVSIDQGFMSSQNVI
jgi:hypothetical protein